MKKIWIVVLAIIIFIAACVSLGGEDNKATSSTQNVLESKVESSSVNSISSQENNSSETSSYGKNSSNSKVTSSKNESSTISSITNSSSQTNTSTDITVYRTPTGKRYHLDPDCGGKNSYSTTLSKAKSSGLTPCKKCAS